MPNPIRMTPIAVASLALLALGACAGEEPADLTPTAPRDGGPGGAEPRDAGAHDVGTHDAGSHDGGSQDAGSRDAGPLSPPVCNPPPLLVLADIPDNPSLDDGDPDTVAIFEVDGHALIGKHVTDVAAAEGGLKLWQELTLRIPENQLLDLVQFEISLDTDPVAYFNRRGAVTTERYGLKLGFSVDNFTRNDPDPCAPLVPRRGTFDWSLVHEFGHLRGWVDRSWDRFLEDFEDVRGSGEGYPEDGSPSLDGDFVTSYAERADGDEDHAESWTTYVMLAEDAVGPAMPDEPLARTKVRWMRDQPGLAELRRAIRITEPGGGGVVAPAPRLAERLPIEPLDVPAWLHGTWEGTFVEGGETIEKRFIFTMDDVVEVTLSGGVEVERQSLQALVDAQRVGRLVVNLREPTLYGYNAAVSPNYRMPLEDSFLRYTDVSGTVLWSRLEGPQDAPLTKID
ncbi:MAG: hypothetical protein RMA76_28015 [Deltaproteobacteria bacterium]|jgi:hypothetical protein